MKPNKETVRLLRLASEMAVIASDWNFDEFETSEPEADEFGMLSSYKLHEMIEAHLLEIDK